MFIIQQFGDIPQFVKEVREMNQRVKAINEQLFGARNHTNDDVAMDTRQEVEKDTIGGDSHLKSSLNMSKGHADHSFHYSNGPWMNSHHTPVQMDDFGGDVPTSHMVIY